MIKSYEIFKHSYDSPSGECHRVGRSFLLDIRQNFTDSK